MVGLDDEQRALLEALYEGEPIELLDAPADVDPQSTQYDAPGQLEGGLERVGNGEACTIAFLGSRTESDGKANLVGLTAGHCVYPGIKVQHAGINIGKDVATTFANDADLGYFDVADGMASNYVFRSATSRLAITAVASGAPAVGSKVCFSGRTTNAEVCGLVTANDATVAYSSGQVLQHMVEVGATSKAGDSGSPFYAGNTAEGVLSGGAPGIIVFTPIARAASHFGVHPLIAANVVQIRALNSGKCLDVTSNLTTNGTKLQQWTCVFPPKSNQQFALVPIPGKDGVHVVDQHSKKCMDLTAGSHADGTPRQIWSCGNSNNNQWWVPLHGLEPSDYPEGFLFFDTAWKCADISNVSTGNGARVWQWQCFLNPPHANQTFRFFTGRERTGDFRD